MTGSIDTFWTLYIGVIFVTGIVGKSGNDLGIESGFSDCSLHFSQNKPDFCRFGKSTILSEFGSVNHPVYFRAPHLPFLRTFLWVVGARVAETATVNM
jgi:hypothetical protein